MTGQATISIPLDELKGFSTSFRQELIDYITNSIDETLPSPSSDGESATVLLSETEAREYLNNCSPASIEILKEMIARDGDFLMSDIVKLTGKSTLQLRGAFAGFTKRARTISHDPDAKLISWLKTDCGDWQGTIPGQTVASMRKALEGRSA